MARYFVPLFLLIFTAFHELQGEKQISFDRHISLPNNPVFCVTQDSKGFMWFGTKNGLLRFDGYDFDVFNAIDGDSTTINYDWVWSLHNDSKGNLWVGTGFGLNIWLPKENRFQNIKLPFDKKNANSFIVRKIFEDPSGQLWIGTNRGLYTGTSKNASLKSMSCTLI